MNDKQVEDVVEKMARVMCNNSFAWSCKACNWGYVPDCTAHKNALKLHEQGYQDCKGKVVLTRGEYNELKDLEKRFDDYLIKEIKEARKETARDILKEFEYCNDKTFFTKWYDLCKQYGVDLGE